MQLHGVVADFCFYCARSQLEEFTAVLHSWCVGLQSKIHPQMESVVRSSRRSILSSLYL